MKGYLPLGSWRIFGAPVQVNWLAVLLMLALLVVLGRHPLLIGLSLCAYLGITLLHEAGHAWVVRRLGYRPFGIYLGFLHGRCVYEAPRSLKHDCLIAWGGVAAQLAVALPLILLALFTGIGRAGLPGIVVKYFGYLNLLIALINLLPLAALDGSKAWRLLPILWAERRAAVR